MLGQLLLVALELGLGLGELVYCLVVDHDDDSRQMMDGGWEMMVDEMMR